VVFEHDDIDPAQKRIGVECPKAIELDAMAVLVMI
jgi:hypothetical protein